MQHWWQHIFYINLLLTVATFIYRDNRVTPHVPITLFPHIDSIYIQTPHISSIYNVEYRNILHLYLYKKNTHFRSRSKKKK